jgi:arylformamidase
VTENGQPETAHVRSTIVDLSHTIEDGMITYKGLPAPIICDFLSREASRAIYADGTEFQIGKIELVSNTGTYLDTPFHRFASGEDLSEISLHSVASLPGIVIDARGGEGRAIGAEILDGCDVAGKAVLIHTGWDAHWRSDAYFEGHPFLAEATAKRLLEGGAVLIGIDSYNIDDTGDMRRPVHTTLLGAGIPIVEHMTGLGRLPASGFRFTAAPPKIKGMGTFPVRAFAILD